ncbi:MAG: hypothetical protein BYD32DRAFT_438877 [Podila humilis]|nr:MAG: hypothetical protein BYD32DRAFT_438877 [Podila humilis]
MISHMAKGPLHTKMRVLHLQIEEQVLVVSRLADLDVCSIQEAPAIIECTTLLSDGSCKLLKICRVPRKRKMMEYNTETLDLGGNRAIVQHKNVWKLKCISNHADLIPIKLILIHWIGTFPSFAKRKRMRNKDIFLLLFTDLLLQCHGTIVQSIQSCHNWINLHFYAGMQEKEEEVK